MMSWISVSCIFFLSGVLGTPPGTENFYSYRQDYDDDLSEYNSEGYERKVGREYNSEGYERKVGRERDYNNYEDEDNDSRYRGSDDWIGGNRRGWMAPSSSIAFSRIPSRHSRPKPNFQKPVSTGWEEEETSWSPPSRRKPSYVVKIRRPVKKNPAWIYFRPPNTGVASGWSRPAEGIPPKPNRRPRPEHKVNTWEEEPTTGSYTKDASYSFAYDAGDSERTEYADPYGTVQGSYSYTDPNGVRRTVHYTAGAATGFKVLNSQPTNLIENVYRDPVAVRRKPSAIVYHVHPDSGWKPWEGRKQSMKGKARTPVPLASVEPEEDLTLDETRYEPQPQAQTQRKPTEQPHLQHQSQPQHHRHYETEQNIEQDFRGYEGGYGDRNPLVVVDKKISPGKLMSLRMRRKKLDQDDERPHPRQKQPTLKSRQKSSGH